MRIVKMYVTNSFSRFELKRFSGLEVTITELKISAVNRPLISAISQPIKYNYSVGPFSKEP